MNREKNLFKNTLVLSFGTILPKFSSIVTLPIITAGLTKSDYGTYDLICILAILFLPIATLKIETAAFRYLIDARDSVNQKKVIITNIFAFISLICAIALTIMFFSLHSINWQTKMLICIYLFVDTIISAARQVVRGLSKNKLYSLSAVINSFFNLLLVVVLISWKNFGLTGILLANIIPLFIAFVHLVISCKLHTYIDIRLISVKEIKRMLKYSWPMVPNSMSSWVINVSDRLVITWLLGIEANAIYAAANKLPALFTMMQGTFSMAWQENASIAYRDEDSNAYYNNMFDRIFCILVGIMAVLISITPILFSLLIRGDYSEAYFQIPILYLGIFFAGIASFLAGIYVAYKETKRVGISTFIAALINLVVNISLIRYIGIYAASLSTVVSYAVLVIYRMRDIQKIQKFKFDYKKIFFSVSLLAGMCIICFQQKLIMDIINMIVGIAVAFGINRKMFLPLIKDKLKSFN
jgi:O-antigen/teichoic acid export membrane protein